MAKFHKLKVKDIRRETKDCVSVAFDIPGDVKPDYSYIQGQYLTLKLNIDGEEVRRSYSVCSSPHADNELRIAVKKVAGGKASNFLNDKLQVGEVLEVMTPLGNFYSKLDPSQQKEYVMFAGGSGITPVLSIIKSVLHIEPKSTIKLFYGNLNEETVIFNDLLENIERQSQSRLKIYHILDKPLKLLNEDIFTGIMSPEKVKRLMERFVRDGANVEYFICGPLGMMESVKETLRHLNIDHGRVHIEYFTPAEELKPSSENKTPVVNSHVTVILDGVETEMELNSHAESILDAALEAGVDVPFACKGAVCCTCRAKVIEGQVSMDMNYALSESEVAQGYILTCQSHPITPKVVIDYDV